MIAVQPGKSYGLTAWVRTSGSLSDGAIGVRGRDGIVKQRKLASQSDYTKVTLDFDAGKESLVQIFTGFWASGKDTWLQLDDIELRLR
ncbi:hypothetical protein [Actinopolymorpha alba]|uniref:hypothetical protein n=1 Tax=Actinopolymorpha alba TaxID=533267 RepID=UPI00037C785D|nr:hypothetical protein [Actinopolymorpha alba]